ncbi:cuticle protein 10.9 [Dermatophagoides farinae]|uniref:Cuticle protein 57a-like protein n=1 Tax=Dermatophagoides farinae TaxID=6954 RepID=A0A922HL50_DERFA|nr:cuticle protein 10.9-like [Dermatophagoides farinae]XP_046913133.1 cuticle protein 10.9-like [Dermatophagoides farinae]KAH7643925.1 cuticle protein 57a-like protein [Dermatophagoides farinae]KAH9497032.1 hypothetical protein DERF_013046 [Dermatophagoides farinae]KAH9497033.1 hypothetical protein DERF_013046 [Dermatophagoides farinae]
MFKEIITLTLCCLFIAVYAAPATTTAEKEEPPHPYNFAYEEKDANFTITRQEEMDEHGTVKGSYSYIDRDGVFRTVNYIADENGFRAAVQSNEPGLTNSAPAAATIQIN